MKKTNKQTNKQTNKKKEKRKETDLLHFLWHTQHENEARFTACLA